jgi:hypothetical protein
VNIDLTPSTHPSFDALTSPTLLPAQETDFTFGLPSRTPQYFPGSSSNVAAARQPAIGELSLLGAHLAISSVLGRTFLAVAASSDAPHRSADVETASRLAKASSFLDALVGLFSPVQHWSTPTLLAYRTQNLELAFLSLWVQIYAIRLLVQRAHLLQAVEKGCSEATGVDEAEKARCRNGMEEMVKSAIGIVEVQEEVRGVRVGLKGVSVQMCVFFSFPLHPSHSGQI